MKATKRVARNTTSRYFREANVFEFDDYMIANSDGTKYALGSAFALAGIPDNTYIRISARQQKILFGNNYIGNKALTLRNGCFELIWSSGFGQDYETHDLFRYIEYRKQQNEQSN